MLLVLMVSYFSFSFAAEGLPDEPPLTQEDITVGNNAIASIRWDVSRAESDNIIILTIPKIDGYGWAVRKDVGDYVGIGLNWEQQYSGYGGETIEMSLTNPKGTGFYIIFYNDSSFRVVREEIYVYFPGSGINFIPPEDRIGVSTDENGDIVQYYDNDDNPISKNDPRVQDPFEHKTLVFSDFNSSYWAYNVIYKLTSLGYIKGYPDGTFRPENNITRAEFSAIMAHLLEDKYPEGAKYDHAGIFPDFTSHHWGYEITQHMLIYITKGDSINVFGDSFHPDQFIAREEVVAAIHATLKNSGKLKEASESVNFRDLEASRFPDSIRYCVKQGFIKGYPDGTFKPNNNITRAEIAAILVEVVEAL